MSENQGVIIHCPSCGDALLAVPRVSSCALGHGELRIHFDAWHVPHKCGPR